MAASELNRNAPRLLGAAFLIVVFTSLISGLLLASVVGTGNISEILLNISKKTMLMRASILGDLITSLGVVVLAVLLYVILRNQGRVMALVALGWWLAEALSLALSKTAAFALIPLSRDFVSAGMPQASYYQAVGDILYHGVVVMQGQTLHMFFYSAGGILWYYLFYKSLYIPRGISLFGLVAVVVGLIGVVFQFFGYDVPILVYLPILPFELTIGAWLLFRGIKDVPEAGSV